MSLSTPEIIYEPIDNRTLSKKEKILYLTSSLGKSRLTRQPSQNSLHNDSEIPETDLFNPPLQSPRERLEAQLRKLDEFWSFKPIPRETVLVSSRECGSRARARITPEGSPTASEFGQSPRGQRSWWI